LHHESPHDEQQEQQQHEGGGGTHDAADDSGVVSPTRTLRFVTREGCGRCADALARVRRMAGRLGVAVNVEDVDASLDLYEAFTDRVPVVLDGAGTVMAAGRIGAGAAAWTVLRARLRRPPAGTAPR